MNFFACRFGPEFGDAPAMLVNEKGDRIQEWVSSGLGFARSDIVRGTDVPQEAVVWLTPPEFKAQFPQLYES